jgi:hypothetical protein
LLAVGAERVGELFEEDPAEPVDTPQWCAEVMRDRTVERLQFSIDDLDRGLLLPCCLVQA